MVCVDNHVDIKITFTGAQIAAYTLTEKRSITTRKTTNSTPSGATKN